MAILTWRSCAHSIFQPVPLQIDQIGRTYQPLTAINQHIDNINQSSLTNHRLLSFQPSLTNHQPYVNSHSAEVLDPSEAPSYIFDASVLRRRRDVVKRATAMSTAFMERHCSHVRVPQFGVGFRGAGAPMHTHHAALNASFAGRVFAILKLAKFEHFSVSLCGCESKSAPSEHQKSSKQLVNGRSSPCGGTHSRVMPTGKKRWLLCPPEVASWNLDPASTSRDRYTSHSAAAHPWSCWTAAALGMLGSSF